MTHSAARAALAAEIGACWERLDQLVADLNGPDWERPVRSDEGQALSWTIADVVLHLAAWKRNGARVARMQADPASKPTNLYPAEVLGFEVDTFNRELFEGTRSREPTHVVTEHRAAHAEMMAALEALPDERILIDGRPRRWLAPLRWHPSRHLDEDILPALGRSLT
jgi:Mycothiol maleylpyruvate isomerase N-terminal domain